VGDRQFQSISEVDSLPLRQRLITAIGELNVFAGGYEVLLAAGVAPPLSIAPAETVQPAQPLGKKQEQFLTSLELADDPALSLEPGRADRPSFARDNEKNDIPPQLSFIEQVDAILQRQLAADPKWRDRRIMLEDDPQGTLRIHVDGAIYRGLDDIEDGAARAAIQSALNEFEKS
jgi:hypothetical protein